MKTIPFNVLKRSTAVGLEKELPLIVTVEGEEKWVLCRKEDVIVIAGMHPHAKIRFRGMENLVRTAMGDTTEKIWEPAKEEKIKVPA